MANMPNKEDYVKTGNDPDELLKIYTDWYDGSIRGMDAEIGRLLEALREMGLDQDTLMVWAADHGEEFWEHGRLLPRPQRLWRIEPGANGLPLAE